MTPKIRPYLFIAIAFLLGSINLLYNVELYILWVLVTIYFIWQDYKGFKENVKQYWKYLLLPVMGVLYLVVHYLISLLIGDITYRASWSRVEILVLNFFFIPIYIVSAKRFVTTRIIKHSLLAMCLGIILFNFVKLFYLTDWALFTDYMTTINGLYANRFGGNIDLFGGYVYLEPQAIYLSISALCSCFILKSKKSIGIKQGGIWCIILISSLFFLSLTVTKGAILAFLCGFIILLFVAFYRMSTKQRLFATVVLSLFVIILYTFTPDAYTQRIRDAQNEIYSLQSGELSGGSIAARWALLKESFNRFSQWGAVGLGVYKNAAAESWFFNSTYLSITSLGGNVHNSFIEFWMIGGIAGLYFILYYFFAPIWQMVKKKEYSFFLIAIICCLFVGNMSCILIVLRDSSAFVIYLLAISYFYRGNIISLGK